MTGNSHDEINCPYKLLSTNRQVVYLRKVFANNSSTDITLSKTQLFKIIQSAGFIGRLLGALLKTGFQLVKNIIKPLAKIDLIPLVLTAAALVVDAGVHKRNLWI